MNSFKLFQLAKKLPFFTPFLPFFPSVAMLCNSKKPDFRINQKSLNEFVKKIGYIFFITCLFLSCSPKKVTNLKPLNGYWEIEKVIMPNGEVKTYKLGTTIDYMELTSDTTGIRKKMQPKLDGTFETSNLEEKFTIEQQAEKTVMHYKTALDSWDETLTKLSEKQLIVTNKEHFKYYYKRFQPFDFNNNGQKK